MKDRLQVVKKYIPRDIQFYQTYIHYLLYAAMGVMGFSIFIVLLNTYQIAHRPFPVFYAQTQSGQRMQITPHAEPSYLTSTVIAFARRMSVDAYTFDFNRENLKKKMNFLQQNFTQGGWIAYSNTIQPVIDSVFKNKILINSVVSDVPVVSNQGPLGDYDMAWRVQIPVLVTYQGEGNPKPQDWMMTMVVVKVPTYVNPQGLAVDQLVMR